MTITADGYLDWATRDESCPRDKVYTQRNSGKMIACHSMVGREGPTEDGIPNRFQSTERLENGRYTAYAAASSMFVLRLDGTLIQCYDIGASTWTSGSRDANCNAWAIEAEGGYYPDFREPLTMAQEDTFIRLVTEWEAWRGVRAIPNVFGAKSPNIYQHKDFAAIYGSDATACASDRYDAAWKRVALGERWEDEDMKVEELNEAMTKREQLRRIASATSEEDGKAYADMLKLHEYARKEGMIR